MEGPIRPKEEQTNVSGEEWKRHPQNQFLDGRRFALLPSRICTYLTSGVALCLSVDPNPYPSESRANMNRRRGLWQNRLVNGGGENNLPPNTNRETRLSLALFLDW